MITIKIETSNAAFEDGNKGLEVARILRTLADQVDDSGWFRFRSLYDANGNKVGAVTLTGKDRGL